MPNILKIIKGCMSNVMNYDVMCDDDMYNNMYIV